MQSINAIQSSEQIRELLKKSKTIAVIGMSPKPHRDSHRVGKYLLDAGYIVYPVNPGQEEILGRKCYKSVSELPLPIDIIDIFRKPEHVLPIVEEVLGLAPLPKAIWMQLGVVNEKAAEIARGRGLQVVMDRCIKVDHNMLKNA